MIVDLLTTTHVQEIDMMQLLAIRLALSILTDPIIPVTTFLVISGTSHHINIHQWTLTTGDLARTINPFHSSSNSLWIAQSLRTRYRQVHVVEMLRHLPEDATRLLRSLRARRNVRLPTICNCLWVLQTVQHPLDRLLAHMFEINRSRNQRLRIPRAYIPTASRLCLHPLKVLHNECNTIHLNPCLYKHLRRQHLPVPGATHRLVRPPVQALIVVVHRPAHRAMVEITGTL